MQQACLNHYFYDLFFNTRAVESAATEDITTGHKALAEVTCKNMNMQTEGAC